MKSSMLKWLMVLALVICGSLAPAAQAALLDFGMGPSQYVTTELKFDPLTTKALIGTDINVYNLSAFTPKNPGLYTVLSGKLNFITGNYIDSSNSRWNFASGGSLTLSGDVGYYAGNGAPIPSNWTSISGGFVTLATGNFTSAMVVGAYVEQLKETFLVTISGFTDTKNDTLETYLGIPTTTNYFGNLNLSFYVLGNKVPGDAFDAKVNQVGSGNFTNNVPLPSTVLLLGTGLVGLVGLRYRRKRQG